jgi:hypothetical protein
MAPVAWIPLAGPRRYLRQDPYRFPSSATSDGTSLLMRSTICPCASFTSAIREARSMALRADICVGGEVRNRHLEGDGILGALARIAEAVRVQQKIESLRVRPGLKRREP